MAAVGDRRAADGRVHVDVDRLVAEVCHRVVLGGPALAWTRVPGVPPPNLPVCARLRERARVDPVALLEAKHLGAVFSKSRGQGSPGGTRSDDEHVELLTVTNAALGAKAPIPDRGLHQLARARYSGGSARTRSRRDSSKGCISHPRIARCIEKPVRSSRMVTTRSSR